MRVSSRGVRTSVGPRMARVHFGAGGTGLSTGAGPVTAYTSLSSGRRRRPSSAAGSVADYEAELRRAQREQRIEEVTALGQRLLGHLEAHKQSFPPIAKPIIEPPRIDIEARVAAAQRDAAKEIARWHPTRRRVAREEAGARAREAAEADQAREIAHAAEAQKAVDATWEQLLANDPATVLATVEDAFADNDVPAAGLDCSADEVTILVRFPPLDGIVPTHTPGRTPTGRPTVRAYSKTERNDLYLAALLSHTYAAVAEAFAVAPAIESVTVLVIQGETSFITPVYAASVTRQAFRAGAWTHDGWAIPAPDGLLKLSGRTRELTGLDLTNELELSATVLELGRQLNASVNPRVKLARPPIQSKSRGDSVDGAGENGFALPARVTQTWLTRTVPDCSEEDFDKLLVALRARGWDESELDTRVRPLRNAG